MKIIAGERRGHKFEGPKTRKIRPASDLIREAIFNILRGEVEDRLVLDLYAGTGALGLEALSRGARRVIFVERDRDHVTLIKRNMATLRYEDRGTAVLSDVLRWVHSFQAPEGEPLIAFLDPPYRDYEAHARRMYSMLGELLQKLPPGSTMVTESRRPLDLSQLFEPDWWEVRKYGSTTLSIARVPEEPGQADQEETVEAFEEVRQEPAGEVQQS